MILDQARRAYNVDPYFSSMVKVIRDAIETLQLCPSEVREAAMLACIMVEERRMPPFMWPIDGGPTK
jgi:hypothetical protein